MTETGKSKFHALGDHRVHSTLVHPVAVAEAASNIIYQHSQI